MEKEQEGCQVHVRVTKQGLAREPFGWSDWCLPITNLCSQPPPSAALTWQPGPGPRLRELISENREKLSRLSRLRRESRWVG